jgi:hypothetical protein
MRKAHVFCPILVCGQVDLAIRALADFLLDGVLVDLELHTAIGVLAGVLGMGIQSFLATE